MADPADPKPAATVDPPSATAAAAARLADTYSQEGDDSVSKNKSCCDCDVMSNKRINQIGEMALLSAQQNSERLGAMMGIRAAQSNPVESAAISSLNQAQAGGNAATMQLSGLLQTMVAALANLARQTPVANPAAQNAPA